MLFEGVCLPALCVCVCCPAISQCNDCVYVLRLLLCDTLMYSGPAGIVQVDPVTSVEQALASSLYVIDT